jgi:capreomycidine synthase
MRLPAAPLEDWLRERYFTAEIDISSSGVQPYTMAELRAITGLRYADLDRLVFTDGYSVGAPEVREAIARRWGDGDAGRVMTCNGSSEAVSLVLSSLLSAGDEVVVVEPGYHLLIEYALSLGCTPRVWRLDPERDWRPSLDELDELVTPRTRAIIMNFPHNPTGSGLTGPELRRVVDIAGRAGAYLLSDAALADLVPDGNRLPHVATLYDRGIDFGTFSKAFGLPGLRFGWCLAPPGVIDGCVRVRDYTTLHVAPILELLALRVIEHADAFVRPRLEQATRNLGILEKWVAENAGRVEMAPVVGGVAAFPRLVGLGSADAFCERLFRDRGVLVVPGSCFGVPEHVRIGYGGSTAELTQGLDRLTEALSDRRPF